MTPSNSHVVLQTAKLPKTCTHIRFADDRLYVVSFSRSSLRLAGSRSTFAGPLPAPDRRTLPPNVLVGFALDLDQVSPPAARMLQTPASDLALP
ncbi:hypothetical protein B0H19DRAFT_1265053 [Mycena capillaripes]|nr:hypothetical protein B0H19DRAFT_1265053 [Mycena capillaripes]